MAAVFNNFIKWDKGHAKARIAAKLPETKNIVDKSGKHLLLIICFQDKRNLILFHY